MIRRVVGVLAALTALPLLALAPTAAHAGGDEGTGHEHRRTSVARITRASEASRSKAEEERDPLSVTITGMTPSVIPRKGPIEVSGTITNDSDETWSLINLYAFVSLSPVTTSSQLAIDAETDPLLPVGNRIVDEDPATFALVDELAPGAVASYSFTVTHDLLMSHIAAPAANGVYWFGVQALGETAAGGRDTLADGRARSFIPLLPKNPDPVRSALVVPIRRDVTYARNGRIGAMRSWTRDLAPGGRLRNLLDFATGAPQGAVTWLIDPSVLEAVQRIADGNPPRDLGPVSDGTGEPTESAEPSPTDGAAVGTGSQSGRPTDTTARWAREWLDRVAVLAGSGTVLGLPYGDVDMAAATNLDPQVATRALAMSASSFQDLGIAADPTVAPPSGYLNAASVAALGQDVTILASDAVLAKPPGKTGDYPSVVVVNNHDINLYDASAASGGPGPTNPYAELDVRQRFVSEAALRSMSASTDPLVLSMPSDWDPGVTPAGFFQGLDLPWLSLVPHQSLTQLDPPLVAAEDLVYPARQANRELGGANFTAADRLFRTGATLQNVLTENTTVEREVAAQALTTASYFKREDPTQAAVSAGTAAATIERTLRQIRISAPPYVTLSSNTGRFRVDLTNNLDQPVSVLIKPIVDDDMEISTTGPVSLAGNSSRSVFLPVRSTRLGVHQVKLVVTDEEGTQLGPHADLPIRAEQTGLIIWVIIGVGAALLFGAIALRLVRRVARRKAA